MKKNNTTKNKMQAYTDKYFLRFNEILKSEGINYTLHTIRKLKQQYPHKFYWTIGADILHDMKGEWYGISELLEETEFIIFNRNRVDLTPVKGMKIREIINIETNNESSSEIRYRIKKGQSLKNLTPLSVQEYIRKRGLYK